MRATATTTYRTWCRTHTIPLGLESADQIIALSQEGNGRHGGKFIYIYYGEMLTYKLVCALYCAVAQPALDNFRSFKVEGVVDDEVIFSFRDFPRAGEKTVKTSVPKSI